MVLRNVVIKKLSCTMQEWWYQRAARHLINENIWTNQWLFASSHDTCTRYATTVMEKRAASRWCSMGTLEPCPEVLADEELGWFGRDLGLSMAGVLIPMTWRDGIGVQQR